MRPAGDRASLTVAAVWSRALLPSDLARDRSVQLGQEAFEVAEVIAPRLRSQPGPRPARFVGFVDALRGQPSQADPRPAGEVDFTILDDEQGEIHARGILNPDDYAVAATAHLASALVAFKAVLRPQPRISRIEGVTDFQRLVLDEDTPAVHAESAT
jgi:hypothetical protein